MAPGYVGGQGLRGAQATASRTDSPMPLTDNSLLLVTGATGLVGRHVLDRALLEGIPSRAFVRDPAQAADFRRQGVDVVRGDLNDTAALATAAVGVTHVVHCAARVGDWGPVEEFHRVNVEGLQCLLRSLSGNHPLPQFVHLSSLGVYPARHHYGSDEETRLDRTGIDGYTRSKVEADLHMQGVAASQRWPSVILRPGFIYGPGDRSVLPRLLQRLKDGRFRYLGDPSRLLNNTFVGNLVEAIFLALRRDDLCGDAFNITDGRLVTKEEFVGTIAKLAGLPRPSRRVPLGIARPLATVLEAIWRWRRMPEAPILSQARIKFLGLNLDYSIDKARHILAYNPTVDFQGAIAATMKSSGVE
jgi:2-alkyl-3-oxoalkanoate reductase